MIYHNENFINMFNIKMSNLRAYTNLMHIIKNSYEFYIKTTQWASMPILNGNR